MKTTPRVRPAKEPAAHVPHGRSETAKTAHRTGAKVPSKRAAAVTKVLPTNVVAERASEVSWVVRKSPIQGRGVFAARRLRKGERILEYTGERIGHVEAGRRYDDEAMERHHTYLFAVDADTCIDGGKIGNDARYINHGCAPNCEARNVRKRIFIHALRTIDAGEELFYDYAYELEGPITMADVKRYACCCGSELCRGTLLAPKLVAEAIAHEDARKKARAERAAVRKNAAETTAPPKKPSPSIPAKPAKKVAAKKSSAPAQVPQEPTGKRPTTALKAARKRREAP